MILRVETVDSERVLLYVQETPDGVNPPNVIELTVWTRGDRGTFDVELRHGNAIEFSEHEDDAPSFPDTVYLDRLPLR